MAPPAGSNNWFVGRAFEQLRRSDDAQYISSGTAGRNEFYYMTANAYDSSSHTLHTYLGSGDREQLMQQTPACGTDNLLACVQAGCTNISATSIENYGSCNHTDTFSALNGLLTHTDSNSCSTSGATCAAGANYTGSVNVSFTCPGSSTTAVSGSSSCDVNGLCSVVPVPTTQLSGTFSARTHNRFYGFASYGGATTRTISSQASAKVFDQNRLTDVSYASACNGGACSLVNTTQAQVSYNTTNPQLITTTCADSSSKCTANSSDPGWYYEFGDLCPLQTCPVAPPWTDEKTGTGANIALGCVSWDGFRPYGVNLSADPCSGSQGAPTVYDYSVNYITGQPSAYCNGTAANGVAYIASQRSVTAAPAGATVRVDVNNKGQENVSLLQTDSGSPTSSKSVGTRSTAGAPIYWLQVPQQLHQCRHVDPTNCN